MDGQIEEVQLYKYTNVMKGWQYRWFILNSESGTLEYYMPEDTRRIRPRGCIHLSGAVISPSEEDSNTFNVNSVGGEIYRLRATDARQRQFWVNRLRTVAEFHSSYTPVQQTSPRAPARTTKSTAQNPAAHFNFTQAHDVGNQNNAHTSTRAQQRVMCNTRSLYDAFSAAQEILVQAESQHHALAKSIEELPNTGGEVHSIDSDMLLLKATSQATLICLKQCLGMLQHQQQAASFQVTGVTGGATMELLDPFSYSLTNWSNSSSNNDVSLAVSSNAGTVHEISLPRNLGKIDINSEDEKTDIEELSESDTASVEDHRTLIIQLLSQLKLGMDLTQVMLPTFILEPFSLLESYANFLNHPDIFLRIPSATSAELRMLAVVEWYLTSFHVGRKGSNAKKPYNPILGELFFCSWKPNCPEEGKDGQTLKFIAEQVSHHPLGSAFYVESSDKTICMNASIGMKSKFMGMAVGIDMIGEAVITDMQHDEDYVITFPNAYARSILSVPWVELNGKVSVACSKTGYSATITFHSKPFYGGKLHRVSAEVKNVQGDVVCKIQGEWNGVVEFTYANGSNKVIDTMLLPTCRKYVRPINLQSEMESRKLWDDVTTALKEDNMKLANEHKRKMEDVQRIKIKQWKDSGKMYSPRYFRNVGDYWEYEDHLKNRSIPA